MDSKEQIDLDSMTEKELHDLKHFLFEEQVRIKAETEQQQQVYEKFLKERLVFMEEMKVLNRKVFLERKRLKEESAFFDKKMQILQNGFFQLDMDRKQFERDKKLKQAKEKHFKPERTSIPYFFKGVNSALGLKKRYKDLMKIFHPDNLCGDVEAVKDINKQYEELKRRFE